MLILLVLSLCAASPPGAAAGSAHGTPFYGVPSLALLLEPPPYVIGLCVGEPGPTVSGSPSTEPSPLELLESEAMELIRIGRKTKQPEAKLQRYALAAELARRLVQIRPDQASFDLLFTALVRAGHEDQAKAVALRWIDLDPHEWKAHLSLARVLTTQGRFEASLRPLDTAEVLASTEKDRRLVLRQRGYSLEKLRRYDAALEAYEAAGDKAAASLIRNKQAHGPGVWLVCGPDFDQAEQERLDDGEARLRKALLALDGGGFDD